MKFFFPYLILMLSVMSGAAETGADVLELDIGRSIEIALKSNRVELLRTIEFYKQSNASYRLSKAAYKPKLNLSMDSEYSGTGTAGEYNIPGGSLHLDYSLISPLGGDIQLSAGYGASMMSGEMNYSPSVSISISQPLSSAEIAYKKSIFRQLKYNKESGEINFKNSVENFIINVMSQYVSLLKLQRSLDRTRTSLLRSKKMLEIARLKADAGAIAGDEAMNLEVEVTLKEDEISVSENSYKKSKERFVRLLGIEKIKLVLKEDIAVEACSLSMQNCVAMALSGRPELKLSRESLYFENLSYMQAKVKNKPDFNLGCSYSFYNQSTTAGIPWEDFKNNGTWSLKAGLSFPIIDGGVYRANLQTAVSRLRISKIALNDLEYNVKREVEEIYMELKMNEKRLKSLERNIELAKKSLRIAEKKFEMGILSQDDVNRTEERLLNSQSSLDDARFNHVLLNAGLFKATGDFENLYDWRKVMTGRLK